MLHMAIQRKAIPKVSKKGDSTATTLQRDSTHGVIISHVCPLCILPWHRGVRWAHLSPAHSSLEHIRSMLLEGAVTGAITHRLSVAFAQCQAPCTLQRTPEGGLAPSPALSFECNTIPGLSIPTLCLQSPFAGLLTFIYHSKYHWSIAGREEMWNEWHRLASSKGKKVVPSLIVVTAPTAPRNTASYKHCAFSRWLNELL